MQRIAIVCCLQFRLTTNREPGRKVQGRTGAQGAAPLSTCRLPNAHSHNSCQWHREYTFLGVRNTLGSGVNIQAVLPSPLPHARPMRCLCGLVGRCEAAAASPTPCMGGVGRAAHTPGPRAGSDGGGTDGRGHLRGALRPSPADPVSGLGAELGQRCCYKHNRNVKEG